MGGLLVLFENFVLYNAMRWEKEKRKMLNFSKKIQAILTTYKSATSTYLIPCEMTVVVLERNNIVAMKTGTHHLLRINAHWFSRATTVSSYVYRSPLPSQQKTAQTYSRVFFILTVFHNFSRFI